MKSGKKTNLSCEDVRKPPPANKPKNIPHHIKVHKKKSKDEAVKRCIQSTCDRTQFQENNKNAEPSPVIPKSDPLFPRVSGVNLSQLKNALKITDVYLCSNRDQQNKTERAIVLDEDIDSNYVDELLLKIQSLKSRLEVFERKIQTHATKLKINDSEVPKNCRHRSKRDANTQVCDVKQIYKNERMGDKKDLKNQSNGSVLMFLQDKDKNCDHTCGKEVASKSNDNFNSALKELRSTAEDLRKKISLLCKEPEQPKKCCQSANKPSSTRSARTSCSRVSTVVFEHFHRQYQQILRTLQSIDAEVKHLSRSQKPGRDFRYKEESSDSEISDQVNEVPRRKHKETSTYETPRAQNSTQVREKPKGGLYYDPESDDIYEERVAAKANQTEFESDHRRVKSTSRQKNVVTLDCQVQRISSTGRYSNSNSSSKHQEFIVATMPTAGPSSRAIAHTDSLQSRSQETRIPVREKPFVADKAGPKTRYQTFSPNSESTNDRTKSLSTLQSNSAKDATSSMLSEIPSEHKRLNSIVIVHEPILPNSKATTPKTNCKKSQTNERALTRKTRIAKDICYDPDTKIGKARLTNYVCYNPETTKFTKCESCTASIHNVPESPIKKKKKGCFGCCRK